MRKRTLLVVGLVALAASSHGMPTAGGGSEPISLHRTYLAGDVSHYEMTGMNDGWHYSLRAEDLIKKDARAKFYEEIGWSDLSSSEAQILSPADLAFRQVLSLDDPVTYMKMPDLSKVQPVLIGPITDLLTFYSDLLLAAQQGLSRPGQQARVERDTPNSWADGHRVLVGEDIIDFDFRITDVSAQQHSLALVVQHLPPSKNHLQLPASWMEAPVATSPNNFVQVQRQGDSFIADVGQETFTVRIQIDTHDGRILSADLDNQVLLKSLVCSDQALLHCGPAKQKTTVRRISLKLLP